MYLFVLFLRPAKVSGDDDRSQSMLALMDHATEPPPKHLKVDAEPVENREKDCGGNGDVRKIYWDTQKKNYMLRASSFGGPIGLLHPVFMFECNRCVGSTESTLEPLDLGIEVIANASTFFVLFPASVLRRARR